MKPLEEAFTELGADVLSETEFRKLRRLINVSQRLSKYSRDGDSLTAHLIWSSDENPSSSSLQCLPIDIVDGMIAPFLSCADVKVLSSTCKALHNVLGTSKRLFLALLQENEKTVRRLGEANKIGLLLSQVYESNSKGAIDVHRLQGGDAILYNALSILFRESKIVARKCVLRQPFGYTVLENDPRVTDTYGVIDDERSYSYYVIQKLFACDELIREDRRRFRTYKLPKEYGHFLPDGKTTFTTFCDMEERNYIRASRTFQEYVMWPFFHTKFLLTEEAGDSIVRSGVAEENDPFQHAEGGPAYYKSSCLVIDFGGKTQNVRNEKSDVVDDDYVVANVWIEEQREQCTGTRTLLRS